LRWDGHGARLPQCLGKSDCRSTGSRVRKARLNNACSPRKRRYESSLLLPSHHARRRRPQMPSTIQTTVCSKDESPAHRATLSTTTTVLAIPMWLKSAVSTEETRLLHEQSIRQDGLDDLTTHNRNWALPLRDVPANLRLTSI
jgi:hypothetical protein